MGARQLRRGVDDSTGALDKADYERMVKTPLTGGSDPVITKAPAGAYTTVIADKPLAN